MGHGLRSLNFTEFLISYKRNHRNIVDVNYKRFNGNSIYRKISNIRRTLVGNKFVDHSDVVGASPVAAAPTTSSFST